MASSKGLKANKPTKFTGSRSCSEEFIQECNGYIQLTDPTASNASRIAFVLLYVKGPAPTAWKWQYCLSRKNQTDTFDEFKKRFFDLFGNPNKKANALTKLERHIQGRKSLEQYVTEFQVLVTETGLMEEDYLICHLVLGLNERLKDKMAMNGDPLWSLDKHVSQLRSWQSAWDTYQGLMSRQTLSPGVLMDIDRKKSTTICTQNLPKLTPDEKERMQ